MTSENKGIVGGLEIGMAACRGRVVRLVWVWVVGGPLKKKMITNKKNSR